MDFKYRIRDLRREKDLTAEELGNKMGVTKFAISMWENGKNQPNNDILLKLADYFDVSLDYLMGRSDIRNPRPITEDDFLVAFSGLSEDLTEEQKKQMIDIANALANTNKIKK